MIKYMNEVCAGLGMWRERMGMAGWSVSTILKNKQNARFEIRSWRSIYQENRKHDKQAAIRWQRVMHRNLKLAKQNNNDDDDDDDNNDMIQDTTVPIDL